MMIKVYHQHKQPIKGDTLPKRWQATTTLEQDGKTGSFTVCNQGEYVADMAPSFSGMVFNAALWGKSVCNAATDLK